MIKISDRTTTMTGTTGDLIEEAVSVIGAIGKLIDEIEDIDNAGKIELKIMVLQGCSGAIFSKGEEKIGFLRTINSKTGEIKQREFGMDKRDPKGQEE